MIDYGFKVKLGPLNKENLEIYRLSRNSVSIYRFCGQYDLITKEDQERWFNNQISNRHSKMFEVINGKDELVGVCGLSDIDHVHRRAEFNIYVVPEYQGNGYSREALQCLFKWGFNSLNLNLIWGETLENNHTAIILFEKLGMKRDGYRRSYYYKDGVYLGAYMFSLLGEECSF